MRGALCNRHRYRQVSRRSAVARERSRDFGADPLGFLQKLVNAYGDVARFRVGRDLVVQLNNPEHIYQVLVTDADAFAKAGALKRASDVLGNGLVASDGDFHRKQRKLLQPAFSRAQIDSYCDAMTEEAVAASERWQPNATMDMFEVMQGITLDIVASTLFGSDLRSVRHEVETGADLRSGVLQFPHVAARRRDEVAAMAKATCTSARGAGSRRRHCPGPCEPRESFRRGLGEHSGFAAEPTLRRRVDVASADARRNGDAVGGGA